MNYVSLFKRGRWLSRSNSMLADKNKLRGMLALLPKYVGKDGLKAVKEQLSLLGHYALDVTHGRYKDYSTASLSLAVAAILYVVSPLDIIPDFVPAGLVDDAAIVAWAFARLGSELKRYCHWRDESHMRGAD